MNILENKDVIILKQQLFSEVSENISKFEGLLLEQEKQVSSWEFANDEFYTLIPFQHELNKQKKGRLLKNIQTKERFEKTSLFSFGFSEDTKLLLVQRSNGENLGVNSKIYRDEDNGSIQYFTICEYSSNKLPSKLISLGMLTPVLNDIQIDIGVSSNQRNWTVTIYKYKNELVSKVFRYSEGWNGQTEYDFVYNNRLLEKIKIGSIDWWKSK